MDPKEWADHIGRMNDFVRQHVASGTAVTPYIRLSGFQQALAQIRRLNKELE